MNSILLGALGGIALAWGPGPTGPVPARSANPADPATDTEQSPRTGLSESRRELLARIDSLGTVDEHAPALDLVREHLVEARATADTLFLLPLLLRQGHIEVFFGNAVEAEMALEEAHALASAIPDSAALCAATRWLAVALDTQGRHEEGYARCIELLALARQRGDRRHEGWAQVGIAWYEETTGRIEASAESYERATEAFHQSEDVFGECWARNGLGVALDRLGKFEDSRRAFEDVVQQATEIGYTLAEILARTNLGTMEWNLGDPGEAERQFHQLVRLHRKIGSAREAVVPELELARCEWSLGKRSLASTRLEALLESCIAKEWRDYEGKVLRHLAELREEESRPQEAILLYRRALDLGSGLAAVDRVECLIGWSDALARLGSPDSALATLDRHLPELRSIAHGELAIELEERRGQRLLELGRFEEAIATLRPADSRAESLGLGRRRVPMLANIGHAWQEEAEPDSALAYFWKARNVWREERRVPREPEWREQRGATGRLVYTDLAELLLHHPTEIPAEERARRAYETIREFKARTLLERRLGPDQSVETSGSLPERDPRVSRTLAPGELFLDYYLGPRTSLLFVIEGESIDVHHLAPEDSLVPISRMFAELVSQPPTGDAAGAGRTAVLASRKVLCPLFPGDVGERIASATRIVCSADGALHLLPFSVLDPTDETANSSGDGEGVPFPIAGKDWCSVPAFGLLEQIRADHQGGPGPLGILALDGGNAREKALPGACREVRKLRGRYEGVETSLPDAPGGNVLASFRGFDVIHLASHARTFDQAPWRSVIDCDLGGGRYGICAEEVAKARFDARLAVLSSCRSAGGRALTGEGIQGLSSAFLASRVSAVVATLWPVEDRSAADLMEHFYRGLEEGRSVSAALRLAQERLREEPETSDPFFWAGFVVVGDGSVEVPMTLRPAGARWWSAAWQSSWRYPWLAVSLGLLVLLGSARARRTLRPSRPGRVPPDRSPAANASDSL